jgi:hypothetical protein
MNTPRAVLAALSILFCSASRLHAVQVAPADTARRSAASDDRPRAVDHSDGYYTRLSVHRVGSYAILPLFAVEYLLGHQLMDSNDPPGWVKGTHEAGAMAIGAVFAVNTVTGLWNLVEARHDPGGARRWTHAALMLAAEAGFLYATTLAGDAGDSHAGAADHRNAALVSIGLSTVGTVLMWVWKGDQ